MLSNLSLVSGLVMYNKAHGTLPVDIVHLSGTNFLLLALCRYTFPSAFCFSLNTHLQSIALFPAFVSFSSNVTLHSSMWMPVAIPSLSILFTAFGSRCPNRLCNVCMQFWRFISDLVTFAISVLCLHSNLYKLFSSLPTANSFSFFLMKH